MVGVRDRRVEGRRGGEGRGEEEIRDRRHLVIKASAPTREG